MTFGDNCSRYHLSLRGQWIEPSWNLKKVYMVDRERYVTERNLAAWSNLMISMDSLYALHPHTVPF
jgi:hypothetical protein